MSINTHTNKSKSTLRLCLRLRPILHLSFIIFLLFMVPKSVTPIPEATSSTKASTRGSIRDCTDVGSRSECSLNAKCRWCHSDTIDDFCFSKSDALWLPSQVFTCDWISSFFWGKKYFPCPAFFRFEMEFFCFLLNLFSLFSAFFLQFHRLKEDLSEMKEDLSLHRWKKGINELANKRMACEEEIGLLYFVGHFCPLKNIPPRVNAL